MDQLQSFLDFLDGNMAYVFSFFALCLFREPLTEFVSKIITVQIKRKDSSINLETAPRPPIQDLKFPSIEKPSSGVDHVSKDELSLEENSDREKNKNWFSDVYSALQEKDLQKARKLFEHYASSESETQKLIERKAFFLHAVFWETKEFSAIRELESLLEQNNVEETRFTVLEYLCMTYNDAALDVKILPMWEKQLHIFTSRYFVSKVLDRIVAHLPNDAEAERRQYKSKVLKRLPEAYSSKEKASLFETLAKIEKLDGNKELSFYCLDKAQEYSDSGSSGLFSLAYEASEENLDFIAASTYSKLLKLEDNATALNNIGAIAQRADLNIKAVDNYKKSAEKNESLALANQGYLLLNAGFADEAEEIALNASKLEDPHDNVFSLINEIKRRRKAQNESWQSLLDDYKKKQKMTREYTESFYLGDKSLLEGNWQTKNRIMVKPKVDNDDIELEWTEPRTALGDEKYIVRVKGKITGSTFKGTYIKENKNTLNSLLLSGDIRDICLGHLSADNNKLYIYSQSQNQNSKPKVSVELVRITSR